MTLIDISWPLREGIPCWPGDTPFQYRLAWTKETSGSVNVGQVVFSTHIGTHIDAPFHFAGDGAKVDELALELYVGKARVIHMSDRENIGAAEMEAFDIAGVTRLLIRTDSWRDCRCFPETICYLRPDLAPYLAEKGVKLVGVDVPSVDLIQSKDLPAHHALWRHGIHILEGLVLSQVGEGDYELIALPLNIVGGDGSPVRAVLRPL
jgi:arylformamidase